MTLEEIKSFLSENKDNSEVKLFLGEIVQGSKEIVINDFKVSKDFKDELQREGDRRVTSALEKFQKETMPKHIEEEITKRFPKESEEQKALRQLKMDFDNLKNEKLREEFKNKTVKLFNDKKLPLDLTDFIQAQDEDTLNSKVEKMYTILESYGNTIKQDMLKGSAVKPTESNGSTVGQWTKEDLSGKTPTEIATATKEGKLNTVLGRTN